MIHYSSSSHWAYLATRPSIDTCFENRYSMRPAMGFETGCLRTCARGPKTSGVDSLERTSRALWEARAAARARHCKEGRRSVHVANGKTCRIARHLRSRRRECVFSPSRSVQVVSRVAEPAALQDAGFLVACAHSRGVAVFIGTARTATYLPRLKSPQISSRKRIRLDCAASTYARSGVPKGALGRRRR